MGKFKEMDLLRQEQERAAPVQDWKTLAEEQAEVIAKMTSEKYPFMHIRVDASEAEKDGALRDKLVELGWTPPAAQPAPWVGLTKDEVDEIWGRLLHRDSRALAIEQRLKEKNRG
jgi:hypothetical protein